MREFAPGEAKTAVAPITMSPAGLSCQAEIFLGPGEMTKVATSGKVAFTSTGVSQNIRLPIAMPAAEGTYRVFIDVYAEGLLVAAYKAIEDVVITGLIGCTFTVINCPPAGAGYEAKFYTPTGAWVPCGEIGSIPYDMDKWRPWFLFIDIDRFSIATGAWGGDIAMWEGYVHNMYNGKHYEFDFATKILREVS